MVDSIVTKRRNTPASQQHKAVISAQTRDLAMGNGLGMAHECLLALLDIGEHYAQSPFSNETMRGFVLDWSTSAADGASCVADILDPNGDGPVGAERHLLLNVHTHAEKSSETMKRLHDFFYKDEGQHLKAMERETVGNLILGMVKPAGVHLERGIKLLDPDRAGFDAFTSEFGGASITAPEPAAVSHATESAGAAKKYDAAADAILESHGTLLALRDLAKQMDVWQCQIFTLGSALMPMTAKVEADLGAVEKALGFDAPKEAMEHIGSADAYAESMSFMAKHLIYAGAAEYDNMDWEEAEQFHKDYSKERLLTCFGASIGALVSRIGHHLDAACEAIGHPSAAIGLSE